MSNHSRRGAYTESLEDLVAAAVGLIISGVAGVVIGILVILSNGLNIGGLLLILAGAACLTFAWNQYSIAKERANSIRQDTKT